MTEHAIDRYIERVRPGLEDRGTAKLELQALIGMAGHGQAPEWLPDYYRKPGQAYSEISPGIVASLLPERGVLVVTTIMARASWSDNERRGRREKKRKAKQRERDFKEWQRSSGQRKKARLKHQAEAA